MESDHYITKGELCPKGLSEVEPITGYALQVVYTHPGSCQGNMTLSAAHLMYLLAGLGTSHTVVSTKHDKD